MWGWGYPQILPDLPPRPHLAIPPRPLMQPRGPDPLSRSRGAGRVLGQPGGRGSTLPAAQVPPGPVGCLPWTPGHSEGLLPAWPAFRFQGSQAFLRSQPSLQYPNGRLALPRDKPPPDTLWDHLGSGAFLTGYAASCKPLNVSDTWLSHPSMRRTSSPPPWPSQLHGPGSSLLPVPHPQPKHYLSNYCVHSP